MPPQPRAQMPMQLPPEMLLQSRLANEHRSPTPQMVRRQLVSPPPRLESSPFEANLRRGKLPGLVDRYSSPIIGERCLHPQLGKEHAGGVHRLGGHVNDLKTTSPVSVLEMRHELMSGLNGPVQGVHIRPLMLDQPRIGSDPPQIVLQHPPLSALANALEQRRPVPKCHTMPTAIGCLYSSSLTKSDPNPAHNSGSSAPSYPREDAVLISDGMGALDPADEWNIMRSIEDAPASVSSIADPSAGAFMNSQTEDFTTPLLADPSRSPSPSDLLNGSELDILDNSLDYEMASLDPDDWPNLFS